MRLMVSAGTPQRSDTFSAAHSGSMKRSAIEGEGGDHAAAIGQLEAAHELGRRIGRQCGHRGVGMAVPDEGRALRIAREEPVIRAARILDDQPGRVGVAQQVFAIDLLAGEQFMDQRADDTGRPYPDGCRSIHPRLPNSRCGWG